MRSSPTCWRSCRPCSDPPAAWSTAHGARPKRAWRAGAHARGHEGSFVLAGPDEHLAQFIPACAGNATAGLTDRIRPPVHPRVCGERTSAASPRRPSTGSSPRVRGTRPPRRGRRIHVRFIPACAGNAGACRSPTGRSTVHPRVCGERHAGVPGIAGKGGSSPRVRGTHATGRSHFYIGRFIPACAGNAAMEARGVGEHAVHPRVCGERVLDGLAHGVNLGSSPRVRGTL